VAASKPTDLVESTAAFIASLPASIQTSPEALYARQLAAVVDATTSARDVATVGKELRATLTDLREAALAAPAKGDGVDDLRRRRESRASATG
jgi:hypothetical protein